MAEELFCRRNYQPSEQSGECRVGVGGQPGVDWIGLDHGVANIRQPVKALTEIEFCHWATSSVGGSDQGECLELGGHDVGIDVTAEHGEAIAIDERIHFQESLRATKHDQPNIDRFAALDAWHQPEHAVEIRNRITHGADLDWPGPDQLLQHLLQRGIVRPLQ